MNNLFSVFDPKSLFSFALNWTSSLVVLLVPASFWIQNSSLKTIIHKILMFVYSEFMAILPRWSNPGSLILPLTLFFLVFLNNFMGLFPYIFTSTSHLTMAISLALPLWLGHMVFAWMKTPNEMLAHLVPLGTPGPLMPFMVLIEMVSNVIRPLTLSVRLAANMIAGHLLLNLLGSLAPQSSYPVLICVLAGVLALGTLEIAVALIQSYVFSVLSTLYLNDVSNTKLE